MAHLLDTNVAIRLRHAEPDALARVAALADAMLSVTALSNWRGASIATRRRCIPAGCGWTPC